jgi:ribosomal protein S6--L-glutamate ligase
MTPTPVDRVVPSKGKSSELREPRVAVVAESHYQSGQQPAGLCSALERAGYKPLILDPDASAGSAVEEIDLLVARGRSPSLLSLVARAEGRGVRTINRCSAIAAVRDKVAMSRTLAADGVKTPATQCGTLLEVAEAFHPSEYPLVVKPVFDDEAAGVQTVAHRDDLLKLTWPYPLVVAQRLVRGTGVELKLYVIGREVFAARTPPAQAKHTSAEHLPVPVSESLEELAIRCGRLFGLEIFGVTCVVNGAIPIVIGVNAFPEMPGLRGASEKLASFVVDRALAQVASCQSQPRH